MPPSLRRAILDAIFGHPTRGGRLEVVSQMDGPFDNADLLVRWRGRVYRVSARRIKWRGPGPGERCGICGKDGGEH